MSEGSPASDGSLAEFWQRVKRKIPHWGREVMDKRIGEFLERLPKGTMHALEVSGWAQENAGWKEYQALCYPEFDICTEEPPKQNADIVFCEQVLEHVPDPIQATKNLFAMLRPGGVAVVSVPFMVRIHNEPGDYWRFTPAGLKLLLERAGFEIDEEGDWGNRAAVISNLWVWCPRIPFVQPMWREEAVPLVVWCVARKPEAAA